MRLEGDVHRRELGDRYARSSGQRQGADPHLPEHRPGIVVAEPIAALIDRVRDAVHRAP